jgi:tetratricopeptide (TPR) repeat protein
VDEGCVDSQLVAAWISGRLAAPDVARLEAHADACEACLHVLAAIGRVCADPHSRSVQRTHGAPVLADWVMLAAAPVHAIGRYRLGGVLGRGGFGVVYEARDRELDRTVAIKALLADPHGPASMRAEARALASLSHPNVVQVYDVVETTGHVYLVMELVRGQTMRAWQQGRSIADALDAYLAAGAGLVAIHDVGLVHADVKPDNLLVAADERGRTRVLVSDFGLSREAAADGVVGGTPRYMAPEQRAGHRIDARADQYSFCVALWEALHGTAPGELARRRVPEPVRAVLRRGLMVDREARWPSMRVLLDALRGAVRRRRGRWVVAATLGGATAIVGTAIGFGDASVARLAHAHVEVPPPSSTAMIEVAEDIERAVEARDRGDLLAAIQLLQPIIDGRRSASVRLQARARQELARTLAVMGLAERAQEQWKVAHETAIAEHADLLAAEIALDLARHDGEHRDTVERARTWLRTAEAELRRVEIDPAEHPEVVLVTAILEASDGRMQAAADGFERVAALPGADEITRVRALSEWAGALGRLGQHELGLAKIAQAHTLCEANGLGHSVERIELRRTAATLLQNVGRFEGAVQEMDLALVLAGEIHGLAAGHLSSLHGDLGIFHLQLNHREESELHLKKAIEFAPDSYAAHANLAIHYDKLACRRDMELPNCDPEASDLGYAHQLRALARGLLDRGELERAVEAYEESCDQLALHFGDDAHQLMNPLYGLVEVNVRLGRREQAGAAAERLYVVAHGSAFAGRKDAIAVLDYVVGRALAWRDPPRGRAADLMKSGLGYFGETPPDDFKLIELWFAG